LMSSAFSKPMYQPIIEVYFNKGWVVDLLEHCLL
jgi:hypothetical protein